MKESDGANGMRRGHDTEDGGGSRQVDGTAEAEEERQATGGRSTRTRRRDESIVPLASGLETIVASPDGSQQQRQEPQQPAQEESHNADRGRLTASQVPLVAHPPDVKLLSLLSNFADAWEPRVPGDTPMFWHIPKSGGSRIKDVMGGCHRLVQATEFGITDGHGGDAEVAIVYPAVPGVGADTDRSPFVNVDTTTLDGIERAKGMGFADANLAQLVASPFLFETNDLFTRNHRGRLFSIFRHPIDRAVSMFHYVRVADAEPGYAPEMREGTVLDYAQSKGVENNWMTRQLSNQLKGSLAEKNLEKAMEVVRTKFLVGLASELEKSMTRVEKYFGMTYRVNPANQEACRRDLMSGGEANPGGQQEEPLLAEDDPAYELLARKNHFDLRLYSYIERLFEEQEEFVSGVPDDVRLVEATCCKCDPPTFPQEGFVCPVAVKNDGSDAISRS